MRAVELEPGAGVAVEVDVGLDVAVGVDVGLDVAAEVVDCAGICVSDVSIAA